VPLPDDTGRTAGFFAQLQDVTGRRRARQALAHQASHDPLTGLGNRHHFRTAAAALLGQPRPDGDVALLFIDVDRFKTVNDRFGHAVGDELLRELAQRLAGAAPEAEIARLGGDEFGVVATMPLDSRTAAQHLADRLHRTCAAVFEVGNRTLRVSLSIGIACAGGGGGRVDDLLNRADAAMYRAKAAGPSQTRFGDGPTVEPTPAGDRPLRRTTRLRWTRTRGRARRSRR
jgi:diguanylate cyclase (GGDEF)-like protein